jgi:hypothetical protein
MTIVSLPHLPQTHCSAVQAMTCSSLGSWAVSCCRPRCLRAGPETPLTVAGQSIVYRIKTRKLRFGSYLHMLGVTNLGTKEVCKISVVDLGANQGIYWPSDTMFPNVTAQCDGGTLIQKGPRIGRITSRIPRSLSRAKQNDNTTYS